MFENNGTVAESEKESLAREVNDTLTGLLQTQQSQVCRSKCNWLLVGGIIHIDTKGKD